MRGSSLLAFLLVFPAAADGSAQSSAVPAQTASTFRIAGKVVSALDAHPLAHASVTLFEQASRSTIATVSSGQDGSFAFAPVAAGRYTLQGSARGFLPAAFDQHEQFSSAVVAGAGLQTNNLTLRLPPEALLTGRLLDEMGEPTRGARLTLYRETHNTGISRIAHFRDTMTNDLGEYELSALAPGTYYLSAQAQPWYAVHPHAGQHDTGQPIGSIDPALDVIYPLTFYPGVTDSAAASPITLRGAERLRLEMHLVPQPAVTLRVHTSAGGEAGFPQLQRKVFDSVEPVQAEIRNNGGEAEIRNNGGEYEIAGLPQGALQFSNIRNGRGRFASVRTVTLGRGVNDLDAAEPNTDAVKLSITLRPEDGSDLPRQMNVVLRHGDQEVAAARRGKDEDEFRFESLIPASYDFIVRGGGRAYRVTRVLANGKDLPTTAFQAGPASAEKLTLVVNGSQTGVHGFARRNEKPAPGTMVVLVPIDQNAARSLYRRDQSDLDGSFNLSGVLPGRYILVAIDDGWSLDWGRPEVLSPYLIHGVPVAITGQEGAKLNLGTPVMAQPR